MREFPTPINDLGVQLYQMAGAAGLGHKDLVESVNFWARVSGVELEAGDGA